MKSGSRLERILKAGHFAVTGELGPPKNGDPEVVRQKARILKGHVDAVNITDCQTAIVRMSSIAAGLITQQEGVEPVVQMTCRDRNRIGMQSDILGASALGLKNLLCLTGDHQKFGNHPGSKGVFDMDSIQLLGMVKNMRDEKQFQCGEAIKSSEPRLFLGCAANPFAFPFEFRAKRLAKKVANGADFVQTQIIYNVEKFARFMEMVRELGLHEKVHILAGVTPPKSLGMARYMKNFVPGVEVPDEVIDRLSAAKDKQDEGINICVDIINQVKEIEGVAGAHVMAIEWEEAVPEIISRAGLDGRPVLDDDQPEAPAAPAPERIEVTTTAPVESKAADAALAEAKAEAEKIIAAAKAEAAKLVETQKSVAPVSTPAPTAEKDTIVETQDEAGEHEMNERERLLALESVQNGLKALKQAFNLTDDQFEALANFAGAKSVLEKDPNVTPAAAAPSAPATPAAPAPETPAPESPAPAAPAAESAAAPATPAEKAPLTPQTAADLPSAVVARYEELMKRAGGTVPSGLTGEAADIAAQDSAKVEKKAEEATAEKQKKEEKAKEPAAEKKAPAKKKAAPAAPVATGDVAALAAQEVPLAERCTKVPADAYTQQYSGAIRETVLGNGDNTITVGGESTMAFQLFEGSMDNKPRIAMDILDVDPSDWPEGLRKHFEDVIGNPVEWARKCVKEYSADAICISLVSTDPNGMNRAAAEAAQTAADVINNIDVPTIVWGCGNAEKDTDTLREITSLIGDKKVCLAPLEDANYRTLGATAMAFQHPIVAASPIDVNLAKQLNILLQNLGVTLDNVLIDPSIGALGYGIEYTYSVMERIRQAALTQQDDKLQVPMICNLGREVWKAKECRLPTDEFLGDQETRSVMMEAITASCMLMAGGELMIMRHPKAVNLTRALIEGLMA
ncbi:MAG: methylenetetrahydrofolate reductase [Desulfobulbaceae bacterium]|nr:MAG: methylenetetrahydrofolate reductase [Desulfobulbaceae bacterium]